MAFPMMQPISQCDLEAKSCMPNWPPWPWRTCEFMCCLADVAGATVALVSLHCLRALLMSRLELFL